MKLNYNYGKLVNKVLVYAPAVLADVTRTIVNPTKEQYAEFGYLPIVTAYPTVPPVEGYHYEPDGWEERDGAIYRTFREVEDPKPGLPDFDAAMERHLLQERSDRGYTTREPDSYLTSSVPRWKQDAEDWVAHRDDVMNYALEIINEVKAGLREPPTLEEFIEGLPKIEWTIQDDSNDDSGDGEK